MFEDITYQNREKDTRFSYHVLGLAETKTDCRKIIMKHLAAYLLLGLGGNTSPSADDVKGVLESVGIDADEERLDKLIAELKGKDLQEVYNVTLLGWRWHISNSTL